MCLGARCGEGVRLDPTAFPLFLFGVASFGGAVREARDKALAKLGSRPDYFSFCGFWLLWLSLSYHLFTYARIYYCWSSQQGFRWCRDSYRKGP